MLSIAFAKTPVTEHDSVYAYANSTLPFALSKLPIKYYDYDNDDDYTVLSKISGVVVNTTEGLDGNKPASTKDIEATKANFKTINDFLKAFDLISTNNNNQTSAKGGAVISVAKDSNKVTVKFSSQTKDASGTVGAQLDISNGLRK